VLAVLRKPVTEPPLPVAMSWTVPATVEQAKASYAVVKDLGVVVQVAVHLASQPVCAIYT
jgi:hypothetical protein